MRFLLTIIVLFFLQNNYAQINGVAEKFIVNKNYNYKSLRKDSIVSLLKKYHQSIFEDLFYVGEFWDTETKLKYKLPDYMLKQEFAEYDMNQIKANLINTFIPSQKYSTAQVGYSYFDSLTNSYNVFCVYTFAIKRINDTLKLFPLLETHNFKSYKRKGVIFYAKNSEKDYNNLSDSLELYNKKLADFFGTEPINYSCYMFETFVDLNTSIGLDVQRNYSRDNKNAYADMYNKIIYSTDIKTFFHELVHLYVGNKYLNTCHILINEGLATYFGGTGNLQLDDHFHNLSLDLKSQPNLDLSNFIDLEGNFTKNLKSHYKFIVGALICKITLEKHGFRGLEILMQSGRTDTEVQKSLCRILNIEKEYLNSFLRKELLKY